METRDYTLRNIEQIKELAKLLKKAIVQKDISLKQIDINNLYKKIFNVNIQNIENLLSNDFEIYVNKLSIEELDLLLSTLVVDINMFKSQLKINNANKTIEKLRHLDGKFYSFERELNIDKIKNLAND